jgi:predicted nucleic acid-binding protein
MRQSIYLDTSVVSAYFDDRIPYQRDITRQWWGYALKEYNVFVSPLTLDELAAAEEKKARSFHSLVEDIPALAGTQEVLKLGQGYVGAGIMPARYGADALHVAYATIYKMDFLVTWNCAHLANVKKIEAISLFNASAGLTVPRIVTPEFFMPEEETE